VQKLKKIACILSIDISNSSPSLKRTQRAGNFLQGIKLLSRAIELVQLMATHRCRKDGTTVVAGSVAFFDLRRRKRGRDGGPSPEEEFVKWPLPRQITCRSLVPGLGRPKAAILP
jgi:hypothetical protein